MRSIPISKYTSYIQNVYESINGTEPLGKAGKTRKKCQNHTISALNGVPGRSRTVDVQLRRLTLYPTEVRGLIHDLDKYAVYMRDLGMNDLLLRRQILYPTEVRRQIYCGIFRFLICVFNGMPLYTENC